MSSQYRSYVMGGIAALGLVMLAGPAVGAGQAIASNIKEVFIANDPAHPVPVEVQGELSVLPAAPLEAVQKTAFTSFPSGSNHTDDVTLYTVPAGKRLVIDSLSISSNLAGVDQRLTHVLFQADNGDVVPYVITVQPVAEGPYAPTGVSVFRKTESVTAYVAPGQSLVARGARDGTDLAHLDALMVAFAGHLVDAP